MVKRAGRKGKGKTRKLETRHAARLGFLRRRKDGKRKDLDPSGPYSYPSLVYLQCEGSRDEESVEQGGGVDGGGQITRPLPVFFPSLSPSLSRPSSFRPPDESSLLLP